MASSRPTQLPPTRWNERQLDSDRMVAIDTFRKERLEEPTEEFSERFARARSVMEDLLETTVDLTRIDDDQALAILTKAPSRDAFRYLAGPPISLDDLKTLVDTNSIAPKTLKENPALVQRIVSTVFDGLDR